MKIWLCMPVFSLFIGIIILLITPSVVYHEINRYMQLSDGSTLFETWSSPRSGMIVEFYFFLVSNVKEFMAGEKPLVKQVGPYSYQQGRSKSSLEVFTQNRTIRYTDKDTFKFIPERSIGAENDVLLVLNIGYIAIVESVRKSDYVAKAADWLIRHYYNSNLFLNKTVREIVWGYEDPAMKFINNFFSVQTRIGLYTGKNNSKGPSFEINDGVEDRDALGQIITWNGHHKSLAWNSPTANQIRGSDGSLFPPFMNSDVGAHVFSNDICRSLHFLPDKESKSVHINSVPTTEYKLSKETFLSPAEYPENRGFCLEYPNCPKSGILDMRTCMAGSPIAISLPHFNGADRSYRDAVLGMHPSPEMDISLYIEPQTGVILQALQMIQVNAMITPNTNFPELCNLKEVVYLPIAYINTTIEVSKTVAQTLMSTLIIPQKCVTAIAWFLIVVGLLGAIRTVLKTAWVCGMVREVSETNEETPLLIEGSPIQHNFHPDLNSPECQTSAQELDFQQSERT